MAPASCRWTARQVDSKTIPHTIPFLISVDESFDVGVDTRYGVDDNDYQPPFRFTGKLDKLTIKLDEPKRTAEEEDFHQETRRKHVEKCEPSERAAMNVKQRKRTRLRLANGPSN